MTAASYLDIAGGRRSTASRVPVVRRDRTGLSLYATRAYAPGEVIFEFRDVSWRIRRDASTVEHPSGAHLHHPLLAKVAHSCDPNGRLDIRSRAMIAIRAVAAGDCLTFDYATTERRISAPFACLCGSGRCRGWIS